MIRVGCCGFPQARQQYYQCLNLVEVQQTFYKLPRLATAQRWRAEAPPGFEFTLKASQLITHPPSSPTYRRAGIKIAHADRLGFFRLTDEVFEAWMRTYEIAQALHARVVVFQCPASFTPTEEHLTNMRTFFSRAARGTLHFAWEPRGAWDDETVAALCRDLDLIHIVDPFRCAPVTRGWAYFRLHGITGYRYRYTGEDLDHLVTLCRNYTPAYCLFNNIGMWADALQFVQNLDRIASA